MYIYTPVYVVPVAISGQLWESIFSSTNTVESGSLSYAPVHCACELLGDSPVSDSHLTVGAVGFQTQAATSGFLLSFKWIPYCQSWTASSFTSEASHQPMNLSLLSYH